MFRRVWALVKYVSGHNVGSSFINVENYRKKTLKDASDMNTSVPLYENSSSTNKLTTIINSIDFE